MGLAPGKSLIRRAIQRPRDQRAPARSEQHGCCLERCRLARKQAENSRAAARHRRFPGALLPKRGNNPCDFWMTFRDDGLKVVSTLVESNSWVALGGGSWRS